MTAQRRIVITGAGRGLGAALAHAFARPATTLILSARRTDELEALAPALRAKGAEVICCPVDVSDPVAVSAWMAQLWEAAPVDLAVFNAGLFAGRDPAGHLESPADAAGLITTNLIGAIAPALILTERMRRRGSGQMLFISSLAAFGPQADAPSYSASKAGLTAFARALREDLAPNGVRVAIAHPGHIRTDQTARHIGSLPGLIPAERAAAIILAGLRKGRSEISFPWHLRLALGLVSVLPWRWQARLTARFRFVVRPPD